MSNQIPTDRRQYPRLDQLIEVSFASTESFIKAYMSNVGSGGLFIKTDEPAELNQKIMVKFYLPHQKEPITVEGMVIWVNPKSGKSLSYPPGMGIKFIRMSSEDKERFNEFITKVIL